jgi:hypothetical protein
MGFLRESSLITGFVARPVPILEQKLPTLPEYLSSTPDLSGIRVVQHFVFCVVRHGRSLFMSFPFYFRLLHWSVLHRFTASDWPLWYIQTVIRTVNVINQFIELLPAGWSIVSQKSQRTNLWGLWKNGFSNMATGFRIISWNLVPSLSFHM